MNGHRPTLTEIPQEIPIKIGFSWHSQKNGMVEMGGGPPQSGSMEAACVAASSKTVGMRSPAHLMLVSCNYLVVNSHYFLFSTRIVKFWPDLEKQQKCMSNL